MKSEINGIKLENSQITGNWTTYTKQQWVKNQSGSQKISYGTLGSLVLRLCTLTAYGLIPSSGTKIPQVTLCNQKYVFILEQTKNGKTTYQNLGDVGKLFIGRNAIWKKKKVINKSTIHLRKKEQTKTKVSKRK